MNNELPTYASCFAANPDIKTFAVCKDTKLVCKDLSDKTVCEAFVISVTHQQTKIEVNDQNLTKIESNEMKTLIIIDQQTFFLPIDLQKHFPELTELSVKDFEFDRKQTSPSQIRHV